MLLLLPGLAASAHPSQLCHVFKIILTSSCGLADKENQAVHQKLAWAEQQRSKGLSTIPSTIGVCSQHGPSPASLYSYQFFETADFLLVVHRCLKSMS